MPPGCNCPKDRTGREHARAVTMSDTLGNFPLTNSEALAVADGCFR